MGWKEYSLYKKITIIVISILLTFIIIGTLFSGSNFIFNIKSIFGLFLGLGLIYLILEFIPRKIINKIAKENKRLKIILWVVYYVFWVLVVLSLGYFLVGKIR